MNLTEVAPRRRTQERHRGPWRTLARYLPLYLSISPFYILFAVFGLFPIAFSLYLSFQKWDGIGAMKFVGLSQYAFLVTDPYFWQSIVNTLEIWIISTIPMLALALVIAFLLNSGLRGQSWYRVAYFIPNVTSIVAIAIIFGSLFGNNFGLLNSLLTALKLPTVPWLIDPWGIKIAIASMVVWRWTGYNAIIYTAGLQSISTELYEAARVDGASTRQIFFRITLPLLRPAMIPAAMYGLIVTFNLFNLIYMVSGGGPLRQTEILVTTAFRLVNEQRLYGLAAAFGIYTMIILLVLTLLTNRITKATESYV